MNKYKFKASEIILSGVFTALIAVGAFIKIPLPAVPFTMQVMFVNLAMLILGGRLSAFSCFSYMLIGLCGFPIFTQGGGLSYVFIPTFGYILGFIFGSLLGGKFLDSCKNKGYTEMAIATLINLSIIYLMGTFYYYFLCNYYLNKPIAAVTVLFYCFLATIPGDIISSVITIITAKRLKPIYIKKIF